MEHDRSVWPQEVQAAASLSPGPKGNTVYVDKARGYPFCEFEVVEGRPPDLIVQIYNTSEVDPGRCEPARFDSIDPQALAKQVGADAVVMNPRRFWMMDRLWSYDAGETYDFDGVKATWMGKLDLKNVKLGEHSKPFPVYKESEITRHAKYDLYFSPLVMMDITRRQLTNLKLGKER